MMDIWIYAPVMLGVIGLLIVIVSPFFLVKGVKERDIDGVLDVCICFVFGLAVFVGWLWSVG